MKDPTGELLAASTAKAVALLNGISGVYNTYPPTGMAALPFVVVEGLPAVRSGSKNTDGSNFVIQYRVAGAAFDHVSVSIAGDALMQGLLPNAITLTNHAITHATLDVVIPGRLAKQGNDSWVEALYRFRYELHEN